MRPDEPLTGLEPLPLDPVPLPMTGLDPEPDSEGLPLGVATAAAPEEVGVTVT